MAAKAISYRLVLPWPWHFLDEILTWQGRILLEETHSALAGVQDGPQLASANQTGVYVGCMYQEYTDVLKLAKGKLNAASATGNSLAFMVGRWASSAASCAFILLYMPYILMNWQAKCKYRAWTNAV